MKNMVIIIRWNVLILFVLLIFLSNSASFANDSEDNNSLERSIEQISDQIKVLNALGLLNAARLNANSIKDELDDLTGGLSLAKYAEGDNVEEIADGLFGVLSNLSLDPVAITVGVASDGVLVIGDLVQSWSLAKKRSWISEAVGEIDKVLSGYETNVAELTTYYETVNQEYIEKYGEPIDPQAPLVLPTANWCELDTDCGSPGTSEADNAKAHRMACEGHKIDGLIFGIGERDCNGYLYSCNPNKKCSRWEDHLQTCGRGHRHKNSEIASHKRLASSEYCTKTQIFYGRSFRCTEVRQYECDPHHDVNSAFHDFIFGPGTYPGPHTYPYPSYYFGSSTTM